MYSNEIRKNSNILRLDNTTVENCEKGRIYLNNQLLIPGVVRPEESTWESEKCRTFFKDDIHEFFFYSQPEGPLVRVYSFEGEWQISTPGKINAHKSFWGSSFSFGQIFDNFLLDIYSDPKTNFWNQLDPKFAYYFYLRPTRHNRIVLSYENDCGQDALIFAGMMPLFALSVTNFMFAPSLSSSILSKIKRIDYVTLLDIYRRDYKPLVALTCFNLVTGKTYKFWNDEYFEKKTLYRSNDAYPLRRYCFLRLTATSHDVEQFIELFPTRNYHYQARFKNFLTLANNILRGSTNPDHTPIIERIGSMSAKTVTVPEAALQILTEVPWSVISRLI